MRKYLVVLLLLLSFAFTAPIASSQVRHRRHRHGRTFWQKHRDKLTVAGGTAAGAGLGGIIGGKKGAGIGALAGGGGSALYTYKLRKRRHRRRY